MKAREQQYKTTLCGKLLGFVEYSVVPATVLIPICFDERYGSIRFICPIMLFILVVGLMGSTAGPYYVPPFLKKRFAKRRITM